MNESVLHPATQPGRHIGPVPILLALALFILLLAGILWGALTRMQDASDQIAVEETTGAQPVIDTSLSREVEDGSANVDGYIPLAGAEPEFPDEGSSQDPVAVVPAIPVQISESLAQRREQIAQQRQQELQDRHLGQLSNPLISTRDLIATSPPPAPQPSPPARPPRTSALDRLTENPSLANLLAGGTGSAITDPNGQSAKHEFIQSASASTALLPHIRTPALSRYELKTGTIIPGVLISGLNSDLPGAVIAQVAQNVYDTATGQHLLVPQGARLFGMYDSRITYGQNRALVVWQRIIFPDASTLELDRMSGSDQAGYSGFADKINNHYFRLFGQVFLLSAIQAAPHELSGDSTSGDNEFGKIAAANYSDTGRQLVERNLAIQPTIRIRPGYKFSIMVSKDIVFRGPYR